MQVVLKSDPLTTYTSNHTTTVGFATINRDGPAATTVELPVGTTRADIQSISVRRVPVGTSGSDASLTVTDLDRAFFLGSHYLPRPSFAQWHGTHTLTVAELWPPAADRPGGTSG